MLNVVSLMFDELDDVWRGMVLLQQVFHLLSQVSLEREDPRSSESLFPEFLAKAESFSLRARGPRSSEQVCSM